MNAPPRPPPRPDPASSYADAPPVVASVPPPAGVPAISVRVPSLTPGGAPVELTGPPGTQLTIPGVPPTVARWILAHAFHFVVLLVVAGLVAAGKLSAGFLETIIALLVGVQVPPIHAGGGPTVIATVPPSSSSSSSSGTGGVPSAPAVVTP